MKMAKSFVIHVAVLLISVVLTYELVSASQSFGDECDHENKHCVVGVGLICQEGRCACAGGPFEQNLAAKMNFKTEWEPAKKRCLATEGSLCVGTRQTPNPNGDNKVECLSSFTCVQLPNLPKGQGTCKAIPSTNAHGSECNQDKYCESSSGLICGEDGQCVCGRGPLDHQRNFNLTWDNERELCVAPLGTPCVGTELNPLPVGAEKRVECETGICSQLQEYPPGIGECKMQGGNPGTSPAPSTTTLPTTTAGARAGKEVALYAILTSVFILLLAQIKA